MKSTGYEYECEVLVNQAIADWKAATDLDPMLPDTSEICEQKLARLNQAERLLADARDTAYFIRNGIWQEESITELLTKIEQYKCPHTKTTEYYAGYEPDNHWEEEYCDLCGAMVATDNAVLSSHRR